MSETSSTTIASERFLSSTEAADFLGFTKATLIKHCDLGKIRAAYFGRRWHFLEADLREYANENRRGKL